MAENDEMKHISLPAKFSIDDTFDNDKFIKIRLDFAHDGTNPNHSRFTKEVLENKKNTLFLSPILGNITQNENGDYEFGGHDMEFRPNPFHDNQMEMYYIEQILGIIPPEELADFEIKEVDGRNRVFVNAYIYKKYSNYAEDILKQYEQSPVSMEIDILKYSFSVTENVYDIEDFKYTGITILNQNCGTGMIGANLKLFSSQEELKSQMLVMLQDLKSAFSLDDNNKNTEERRIKDLETNTNVENVTNENVDTSTPIAPEVNTEETNPVEPVAEPTEPVVDTETPAEPTDTMENTEEVNTSVTENNIEANTEPETSNTENIVRTFIISHDDIRYALYNLMDISCDNSLYITDVYDEFFDYVDSDCTFNKCKRRRYTKNEATGTVQLDGDCIDIYIEKLTETEKSTLDMLRNTYSVEHTELESLREFKAKYDLAEKEALINKWSAQIGKETAFAELKNNFKELSLNEIDVKCKCIFADSKATFSTTFSKIEKDFNPVVVNISDTTNENKDDDVYGGLFAEFGMKKN